MSIIKLQRYEGNPIMTANPDNKWENLNVSNAGATVHNGKVYLLYRAEGEEMRQGRVVWPVTRIGLAISEDGYTILERSDEPVIDRDINNPWKFHAVEDPRITKIDDTYYIVYTAMGLYSDKGERLMLATTKDFVHFEEKGLLMPSLEQRTSGLLPAKVDGNFVLYHRPLPNMWVSFSKDLHEWTDMKCILETKPGSWYENKLGLGAQPIETEYGYIIFWHGKNNKEEYALGIMLVDKNNPTRILKIQEEPVLTVEEEYEKKGFIDNVVYTNGAVLFKDKFFVYYGCSDHVLSVATVDAKDVYDWCVSP